MKGVLVLVLVAALLLVCEARSVSKPQAALNRYAIYPQLFKQTSSEYDIIYIYKYIATFDHKVLMLMLYFL